MIVLKDEACLDECANLGTMGAIRSLAGIVFRGAPLDALHDQKFWLKLFWVPKGSPADRAIASTSSSCGSFWEH